MLDRQTSDCCRQACNGPADGKARGTASPVGRAGDLGRACSTRTARLTHPAADAACVCGQLPRTACCHDRAVQTARAAPVPFIADGERGADGHRRRRAELGPWDESASAPVCTLPSSNIWPTTGLPRSATTATATPHRPLVNGVDFPVHVLAINALGMHLLDCLQFEDLAGVCQSAGRWSFLCVIAPLRLPRATGSPVNPIAIL